MKTKLFCFLCTLLLISCRNDDLSDDSTVSNVPALRSGTIDDPLSQLEGIALYIDLPESAASRRSQRYLTARGDDPRLYLHKADDGSGRQRFYIRKTATLGGNFCYAITVQAGAYKGYTLLNTSKDSYGTFYPDLKTVAGSFIIKNVDSSSNFFKIICEPSAYINNPNGAYYLTSEDKNLFVSFRNPTTDIIQQWQIRPIETFEVVKMSYTINSGDYITQKPSFVTSATVNNSTAVTQTMSFIFQDKAGETSSFSKTKGFSVSVNAGGKIGIPLVSEGSLSTTSTSSLTWNYGQSQSQEDARTYNFNVVAPPYSSIQAQAIVQLFDVSATYIVTLRGTTTGREIQLTGTWKGIKAGEINYNLIQTSTGQVLKSIKGVSDQPVTIN